MFRVCVCVCGCGCVCVCVCGCVCGCGCVCVCAFPSTVKSNAKCATSLRARIAPLTALPHARAFTGAIYVDAAKGSDGNKGATPATPLQTIGKAIDVATASSTTKTIVLAAGVYHGCDGQGNVCSLGTEQSGITIMNST